MCNYDHLQEALTHIFGAYALYVTLIFFRPVIVNTAYGLSLWAKNKNHTKLAKMIAAMGLGPSRLGMGPFSFIVVSCVCVFKELVLLITTGYMDIFNIFFSSLGAFLGFSVLNTFRRVVFRKTKGA